MQKIVDWLLARAWRLPLTFVLLAIIPDGSYLWLLGLLASTAILVLVGLREGAGPALRLGVTGVLAVAVVAYLMQAVQPGVLHPMLSSRLLLWVPGLLAALVVRRSQSLVLGVQALLLLGLGALGAVFLVDDPVAWWSRQWGDDLQGDVLRVMTGVVTATCTALVIGALLLGRRAERLAGRGGGAAREFGALSMGKVLSVMAVAFFLLGAVESAVYFANGTWVLAAGFAFQGLAVTHVWMTSRGLRGGWLVALYVAIGLTFFATVPLIAALGFVDNWFNLRRRLRPQ